MLRGKNRNVQLLFLLCAVCRLSLAFPALTPPTFEAGTHLQVKIPHSDVIISSLGGSVAVPCVVSLSSAQSSPIEPRVKWTVVSNGVEQQIVVARGQRVKVNDAFKDRAALPNYSSSPDDLTLLLSDVRSSDSGHYRCEVQQGLEDASALIQLKIKGVVFHYRDALGRYAFSFPQAQKACEAIGANMATADQLIAAYHDGYEQCDAGWLADQSVRYPIQVPRVGCYGDMDGLPGVRNYGTVDPDNLYDVYCFIDHMDGEVFHEPVPQQLSFPEAQSYCRAAGAELASTAQLYLAWSEGLDRCSPGWLSDGSVRYPIINPRERCGGSQTGVKTVYRFSNQTGFPTPSSLHDVYCFRGNDNVPAAIHYTPEESEDLGESVVILTEKDQELQLHQAEHIEREALSFLESFSLFSASSTEKTPAVSNTTESSYNSTSEPVIQFNNVTATPEIHQEELEEDSLEDNNTILEDGEHNNVTEMVNTTSEKMEDQTTSQDFSASLKENYNSTHNETQHTFNFTFERPEVAAGLPENGTKNQTAAGQEDGELTEDEDEEILNLAFEKEGEENSTHNDFSASLNEKNNSTHNETEHTSNSTFDQPQFENATDSPPDTKNHTEVTEEATEQVENEESLQTNTTEEEDTSHEDGFDENITEETNTTLATMLQLEEAKVSDPEEISLLTDKPEEEPTILTEPTQAFTSSTVELTPWLSPDGSGDDSQEADLTTNATTLNFNPLSDSPNSNGTTPLAFSTMPSSTPPHSAVPNLTTSAEREIFKQEGSTSLEVEDAAMVGSEEITQLPTKSDSLLISSVSFGTTESPEVSYSSMKPNYREYLEVVTDAFQEASGDESETVIALFDEIKPTLEDAVSSTHQDEQEGDSLEDENANIEDEENNHLNEAVNSTFEVDRDAATAQDDVTAGLNVGNETKTTQEYITTTEVLSTVKPTQSPTSNKDFAFPIDSQTTHWTSLTTTTGPQESLNRETSTLAQYSPKTTTTRPHWTRRTPWTLTTAVAEVNPETGNPHTVTVHIPPVDTGRVDHEFSLTPPPTLHILPVERAAIGGAGIISDGCLKDPCLNGGTCTEQNGQIKCLCLPTYGGDLCETDLEHCEVGWDKFQGFCYRHFGRRLSWEVAEQHCRMQGAHLVSIMSPEEQSFINNFYKEYQWTGLNDKAIENDFRWSDGNPMLYENWYRGQPDSYFLSGEDCVVMVWHDSGRWSDVPCNYHLAYTCKKGTSSCGPPPKVRNASIFGKVKPRYATDAAVRYHCAEGFRQRMNPLIRCLSGGKWERPQIRCIPVNGSPAQDLDVTSPDDRNLAAVENEFDFYEFETPKKTPQYWDIKF